VEKGRAVPAELRKGDLTLRPFTTRTTLGTPHDIITLQELRKPPKRRPGRSPAPDEA
jgi:hypothetical protein